MKIDQEFKSLIPALTNDEYKQLEENIISEGCRDALVTWNDTLVDGNNRYEICTKNNIPFKTVAIEFENREEVIEWIIKNQFGRRNLSKSVRIKLALKLKKVISEMAKKNQKTSTGGSNPQLMTKDTEAVKPILTRKELAKIAKVGEGTIYRMEVIEREASQEQKDAITNETKEIGTVFHELGHGLPKPKIEVVEEGTKICTVCGIRKPISEFYKGGMCKTCTNYVRASNNPDVLKNLRSMNSSVVDGVDTILEDMKSKKPSEEGKNKFIYNESISQLEEIINKFNIDINKFLYMKSTFKDQTSSKDLLSKTILNLKTIINLMEA